MIRPRHHRKQSTFDKVVDALLDQPWLDTLPKLKRAIFRKRERIRYLQDNIIAYQDQAWGDGEILVNYRCTPGKPVDCYRMGHKWRMLISRRGVKNRADIDTFNIEWEIRNGFLRPTGYWETHVTHVTQMIRVSLVFPQSRDPSQLDFTERNRQRRHSASDVSKTRLPDGRCQITWFEKSPKLFETYNVQWQW